MTRGARRRRAGAWPITLDDRAVVLICALLHAALFLWLFKATSLYYVTGSDTQHVYWPAVQKLLAGRTPYRDPSFFVEYPPLGTAIVLLPALLRPASLRLYDWRFAAEMLAADVVILVLLLLLARRLRLPTTGTVLAYSVIMPLLGAVVCQRYDLVPAALTLAALWALLQGRSGWAWGLLLAATLSKLYPAVLAPLFLVYEWRRGRRAGALLYVAGLAAFALAWQAWAPLSLHRFLLWETRRGLEIESLGGSLVLVAHLLGLPAHIVPPSVYGSYDVASALTPALETLSSVLTAGALAAVYLEYVARTAPSHAARTPNVAGFRSVAVGQAADATSSAGKLLTRGRDAIRDGFTRSPGRAVPPAERQGGDVTEARWLIVHSALAVLAVLLGSKLLSIQFLLWVLPLLVAQPWRRRRVVALTLVAVVLSQWLFPFHWNELWAFHWFTVLMMALRNGLLVALFVLLWAGVDTRRDGTYTA